MPSNNDKTAVLPVGWSPIWSVLDLLVLFTISLLQAHTHWTRIIRMFACIGSVAGRRSGRAKSTTSMQITNGKCTTSLWSRSPALLKAIWPLRTHRSQKSVRRKFSESLKIFNKKFNTLNFLFHKNNIKRWKDEKDDKKQKGFHSRLAHRQRSLAGSVEGEVAEAEAQ